MTWRTPAALAHLMSTRDEENEMNELEEIDTSAAAERRIRQDIDDARKTLARAQQRFDVLCADLRTLLATRADQQRQNGN